MRLQSFIGIFLSLALHAQTSPAQWGENVTGVTTKFHSNKKEIALTFDACGGSERSSQYDEALIDFLTANHIPATLFINARWIDRNLETFIKLSRNPLFEIANHGTAHKPLSVEGKSVYGIQGTASADEVIAEIQGNNLKIEKLTGKRPLFFRAGTAFYDEQSVAIAHTLGMEIGGFSVLGDAGATFSAPKVTQQLMSAKSGDIVLFHMNHPEGGTREGIIQGVEALLKEGYTFVRLNDVKKSLIKIP
ncbi:MAG: polysaccharide deacetylase family protein [Epsilonproteobacteria bacterium]|nr:polysaccharide deacetylase family protein [Campylobacterota bacterium]